MDLDLHDPFDEAPRDAVAVVGMAGRFPGARDLTELWHNLSHGVDAVSFFTAEELIDAGIDPALVARPDYVRASAVLADAEHFDAAFFGMSPREAELTDPQQRLFLECAHAALEDAGYDPARSTRAVAVYGGASLSGYWICNLYPAYLADPTLGFYPAVLASDKDFLATRVAYKLGLHGPCATVQTACSTSLVAVHLACQALLNGECEMALAGGVGVSQVGKSGYVYQEGGILSPDGHCRTFDARAGGTVAGQGVGVVTLKRLDDALADRDTIRAVILGSAINNDGARKAGFTAPSIEAQRDVIREALGVAGVAADTLSYVEAHGTGTELGDPIEVAGLTEAFRASTDAVQFCALGSVKSNFGHLDAAAGVAGLIKTVLALEHEQIPPSLHFTTPNPQIDFAATPFYVNDRLAAWRRGDQPRRAGVSAFGIGGTNAHVILEEAPLPAPRDEVPRPWHLLPVSARSETALAAAVERLATHLERRPEAFADAAYTLTVGRRALVHRTFAAARTGTAAAALRTRRRPQRVREEGPLVAFLFPGQGAQAPGTGAELYAGEPTFRREIDRCAEVLAPTLGADLPTLLFSGSGAEAAGRLDQTLYAQPALFALEHALARLWMSWGVQPAAMLGHSLGELVAACVAGVFRLEDALTLVAARGRLMQSLPPGAMLAVPLAEEELTPLLGDELALAAVNGPARAVVSGGEPAVAALAAELTARGVPHRRLRTSHAFHSPMVEPVRKAFAELVARVPRRPPEIPWLSNVTGTWITAEQAVDPAYWSRHLRATVRFADGVRELASAPRRALLEVGPGDDLTRLARRLVGRDTPAVSTLPRPGDGWETLLTAAGELWSAGATLDADGVFAGQERGRVPLPTYPFERKPYWLKPPVSMRKTERAASTASAGSESRGTRPEAAGTESRGTRPESRGTSPEAPGTESPGTGPESPGTESRTESPGTGLPGVEEMIERQLELLAQQLAVLRQAGVEPHESV